MPSPRPCAEMDDFFAAGPDLEAMGRAELLDCLAAVRQRIARLDQEEPEDMDSEAYDAWGDRHEAGLFGADYIVVGVVVLDEQ